MYRDHFAHRIKDKSHYRDDELHDDVRYTFVYIFRGLRSLYDVCAISAYRLNWDDAIQKMDGAENWDSSTGDPKYLREWAMPMTFPTGWINTIDPSESLLLPGAWNVLRHCASDMPGIVKGSRRALYAAQFGPLASLRESSETYFDREAEGLVNAVSRLSAFADQWSMGQSGFDRAMLHRRFYLEASTMMHESVLTNASRYVDLMFKEAKCATELLQRPDEEQHILIDGTWIFDRIHHMSKRAKVRTGMVPTEFDDAEAWREYTDLVAELIEFAATLGQNSMQIIGPLTSVKVFGSEMQSNIEGEVAVPDPSSFEAAYNVLRNSTFVAISKIIPDRFAWRRAATAGGTPASRERPPQISRNQDASAKPTELPSVQEANSIAAEPPKEEPIGVNYPAPDSVQPPAHSHFPPVAFTDGLFSPAELAGKYGVGVEAARKALTRWRKNHAGGDGYMQNPDRRPNEPEFLYSAHAVGTVMNGLKSRSTKREIRRTKTSGQHPAKKNTSRVSPGNTERP